MLRNRSTFDRCRPAVRYRLQLARLRQSLLLLERLGFGLNSPRMHRLLLLIALWRRHDRPRSIPKPAQSPHQSTFLQRVDMSTAELSVCKARERPHPSNGAMPARVDSSTGKWKDSTPSARSVVRSTILCSAGFSPVREHRSDSVSEEAV